MKLSDAEKLILMMLCEIHEKLKIENGIDTGVVKEAIYGGHYWGLRWACPGLFHDHEDREEQVRRVVDVMDMWRFLERGFAKLSPKEKQRVEKKAGGFGDVRFRGWDSNGEAVYIGIARYMIEHLDKFESFKGRDLDSRLPMVATYGRMYGVFEPIRQALESRELNVDEILQILAAAVHPENKQGSAGPSSRPPKVGPWS